MSSIRREIEGRIQRGDIELPVFPASAREVIALCEHDDVDPRKLADVIRRDASLAGHFLAIANSATFGAGRAPLVSLQQALTRLGLTQTKQIAMVVVCKTRAFSIPGRPERAAQILSHALTTALFAQEIARARRLNVEEAFLSGLLHDIGEPAALQLVAEIDSKTGEATDAAAADEVAEKFHAHIGGLIATRWTMSAVIRDAILNHHDPVTIGTKATTAIVQLADVLASGERDVANHPATNLLNLYAEDIERLTTKVDAAAA
jgi:putative nucleotidyltransferase with HDIG domain